MMNKDFASGPRNSTTFFIIKTSIRVNNVAGFLDLVKHSIINLDVTEILDPPQVFTC